MNLFDETTWNLWRDWNSALGLNHMEYIPEKLDRFFQDVPIAKSTRERREKALIRTFLYKGMEISVPEKEQRSIFWREGDAWAPLESTLAAIPTIGWPDGFRGRRDAYIAVLAHQGATREEIRKMEPGDIGWPRPGTLTIKGSPVPSSLDPEQCAACALARWLKAVALTDVRGRGALRETLVLQQGRTVGHVCMGEDSGEWRRVLWTLVPAIDRHGWHETGISMSTRAISAVLAYRQGIPFLRLPSNSVRVAQRLAETEIYADLDADAPRPVIERNYDPDISLDDLFDRIDDQFDAAEEVISRIEAYASDFEKEMDRLYGRATDTDEDE